MGLQECTMDLTMRVLQADSLGTLSSSTSLLFCLTPVFTGMYRAFRLSHGAFPLLPRSTLIARTEVPQRLRGDNDWYEVVFLTACISGSKTIFALVVFSRLSHWWFYSQVEGYVGPLFLPPFSISPFILIFTSKRTNNEK